MSKKYSYLFSVDDPEVEKWLRTQVNKKSSLQLLIKTAVLQYGMQDLLSMYYHKVAANLGSDTDILENAAKVNNSSEPDIETTSSSSSESTSTSASESVSEVVASEKMSASVSSSEAMVKSNESVPKSELESESESKTNFKPETFNMLPNND